jgi:hypothetical protein
MTAAHPSLRSEAVCLAAILAAGALMLWQQRDLARLAGSPSAILQPQTRAVRLAAEQRVNRLEGELATAPKAAAPNPGAAMMASDQVRRLQLRVETSRSRDSVEAAYGPLIKALGLDPAMARQFLALLSQERLTARDALVAAQAQGIQSVPGFKAAVEEAVGRDDEQIGALLSPAGFAQFDAYRQTLPEQQTVAALAERLSGTPAPLDEGQEAQLVQLINRMEPPAYQQNQAFLALIGVDNAPLTPAMVSAAPAVLSPPQVSALQALASAWLAKAQLQQALRSRPAPRSAP